MVRERSRLYVNSFQSIIPMDVEGYLLQPTSSTRLVPQLPQLPVIMGTTPHVRVLVRTRGISKNGKLGMEVSLGIGIPAICVVILAWWFPSNNRQGHVEGHPWFPPYILSSLGHSLSTEYNPFPLVQIVVLEACFTTCHCLQY